MPEIDASIYNKLNSGQQQNGLGAMNPAQVMDFANKAIELQTKQGVSNALQGAYDETYPGGVDPKKLNQGLRAPGIRLDPETANSAYVLQQRARDYSIQQNAAVQDFVGTLANDRSMTKAGAYEAALRHSARTGIPPQVYINALSGAPDDPNGLHDHLERLRNAAMGSAATAAPVAGAPGPAGQPSVQPLGAANFNQVAPGVQPAPGQRSSSARPVGLPPGQPEAQQKLGAASAEAAIDLRKSADSSMARKAMLGNMEQELDQFTSGPGADWNRVAKAWVNRNVPLPSGWQFDPKTIASQEEFNKQAYMLAANQFQAIGGTGTDEKFGAAFHMNPNETMSSLGNKGVMRMLKGNEDAIQAKNRSWRDWLKTHSPDTYDDFSAAFNSHFDPRAFQFKYIPQKERQDYINKMDPEERDRFLSDLTFAHQQRWISFEGKK